MFAPLKAFLSHLQTEKRVGDITLLNLFNLLQIVLRDTCHGFKQWQQNLISELMKCTMAATA